MKNKNLKKGSLNLERQKDLEKLKKMIKKDLAKPQNQKILKALAKL